MILKSVVSAALSELAAVGTDDAARQAALKRIKGVLRSLATVRVRVESFFYAA